ncbi:MAG TPA: Hsp70 family protein [Stackebrandtia sp.]|uniref:Hsp70 family protein n=1 Tax=Stackebrandtia sp. TaxID=2023065 RepID=UPI002D62528F|nr:Hsp70 family protein [Stackebrandtia sp.]HZE38695.1 Hsp70 family protein [Stackebrandtia sp.]
MRVETERVAGKPPSAIVMTHPEAWGATRRRLLLEAARRAGLGEPRLVAEPVAAASFYARLPRVSVVQGACVAAFDLGAGTFDVSVSRLAAGGFEVLVSDGLDDVGGADLDEVVVAQAGLSVAAAMPAEWRRLTSPSSVDDRRARFELREAARLAKESLTTRAAAEFRIPLTRRETHITRAEFDRRPSRCWNAPWAPPTRCFGARSWPAPT